MSYQIEDIDYTGCDPVIVECLKSGKKIKCRCYDTGATEVVDVWVLGYKANERYRYVTDIKTFSFAKPIERKRKVKSFVEIAKWLEKNNYVCNGEGNWEPGDARLFPIYPMYLFCYCGREIRDGAYFPEEWLEE